MNDAENEKNGNPKNTAISIGKGVKIKDNGETFSKFSEIYPWRSPIPVVFVEGDSSEMGQQFGLATKDVIQRVVKFNIPILRGILSKSNVNASDYIESSEYAIKKYTESEYLDELSAMAEAADVDYKDLLLTNLNFGILSSYPSPESHYPMYPETISEKPMNCSSFSAFGSATENGSMVAGHNDDGARYMDQFLALKIAKPKKGKNFVSPVVPGYIGYHSVVNSSHSFLCATGISDVMRNEELTPEGVPTWFLFRWLGQFSESRGDAVKRFLSVPNKAIVSNWCFSSLNEGTTILNATPKHHAIAKYPDESKEWTATGGKLLTPELEPFILKVRHPNEGDYRHESAERAVRMNLGKINLQSGIEILSDHFDYSTNSYSASENTVCRHMEYGGGFGGTVRSIVIEISNKPEISETVTEVAVSLGNPCNGIWRKLTFDDKMNMLT